MSTFEILFLILVTIFVFSSLYFAISGRKLNIEEAEKNEERYLANNTLEEELNVLITRIGEICTENDRLNKVVREWMNAASTYKQQLDESKKSEEEWIKQSESYKLKYEEANEKIKQLSNDNK